MMRISAFGGYAEVGSDGGWRRFWWPRRSVFGVVVTCSTTEYHPFMLARKWNALDHVSEGVSGGMW